MDDFYSFLDLLSAKLSFSAEFKRDDFIREGVIGAYERLLADLATDVRYEAAHSQLLGKLERLKNDADLIKAMDDFVGTLPREERFPLIAKSLQSSSQSLISRLKAAGLLNDASIAKLKLELERKDKELDLAAGLKGNGDDAAATLQRLSQ